MSLDFFGSAVRSDSPATLPNERTRFAVPLRIKINFAYYIVFSDFVKRGGEAPHPVRAAARDYYSRSRWSLASHLHAERSRLVILLVQNSQLDRGAFDAFEGFDLLNRLVDRAFVGSVGHDNHRDGSVGLPVAISVLKQGRNGNRRRS